MKNKKCPECSKLMREKIVNGKTIDKCHKCGGVFLDFGEMKEIIENISINKSFKKIQKGDFIKDNLGKDIICANCGTHMEEREYIYGSGNHINFCKNCFSIYLDIGELQQVQDFEISRLKSKQGKELLKKIDLIGVNTSNNQAKYLEKMEKHNKKTVLPMLSFLSKLFYK